MRTFGLVGGMGSQATVHAFDCIVSQTNAKNDQDHIPLVIANDPSIPDRTEYILGEGPTPLNAIMKHVERFKQLNLDYFAIPCNTAHYFSDTFHFVQGITFIDMVEATLDALKGKKAILLSTKGTVAGDVYGRGDVIYPACDVQRTVNEEIYRLKRGEDEKTVASRLLKTLKAVYDADTTLVLGCSELSMIRPHLSTFECVSSIDALAAEIVRIHERSVRDDS